MRSDSEFIRWIEKDAGLIVAKGIQRLPYIEIDQKTANEKIWPATKLWPNPVLLDEQEDTIQQRQITGYAMRHLPFNEFVLRVPSTPYEPHLKGDLYAFAYIMPPEIMHIEGMEKNVRRILLFASHNKRIVSNRTFVYCLDTGLSFFDKNMSDSAPLVKSLFVFESYCIHCLAYLALCPERIVETKIVSKPSRQERKLAEKDISYDTTLPTYILMDPTVAPKYQPASMRAIAEARGALKKPHARRGHWRRLPDKVVRVRDAWIGKREWTYQNRSYKVIEADSNSDADAVE